MNVRERWVLRGDVEILPVAELAAELRDRLDADATDFTVSRPSSRSPAKLVEARAADLLRRFREPRTPAEVIVAFSRENGIEPQEILEDTYLLLRRFASQRFLLPADAAARADEAALAPGEQILGLTVLRDVHRTDDTEIYLVRTSADGFAALKLEKNRGADSAGALEREAAVLRRLGGKGSPRLLGQGTVDGRRYLLSSWVSGVDAATAAAEWRVSPGAAVRTRQLELCHRIATAYADLHRRDVVHGDVHPRNVFVDDLGGVTLLDFDLARLLDDETEDKPPRGGVPFYYEPEHARALLDGEPPGPATPAGEQYALATLLYFLVTGTTYLDFHLERRKTLRQILTEDPVPFARRRLEEPRLEAVLRRALAKAPEERFASLDELCSALAETLPRNAPRERSPALFLPSADRLTAVLERFLETSRDEAEGAEPELDTRMDASVGRGAAGVAYALLRIACQRDDPLLLARADRWAHRAAAAEADAASFLYGASGIFVVQAMIAHATGEPTAQAETIGRFVEASGHPPPDESLALGTAGTLLAAALLLPTLSPTVRQSPSPLRRLGVRALDRLSSYMAGQAPLSEASFDLLGMAHGWAGLLYAVLQWCQATGDAPPSAVTVRLAEMAELAEPAGRGLRWRRRLDPTEDHAPRSSAGWCAGSAGYVLLWTLAARTCAEPSYLKLAAGAAADAWDSPEAISDLCCGLAGRAYGLLHLYRQTGERLWLERARLLGNRAAERRLFPLDEPHSLFKGATSLALLAADFTRPEEALFPFCESVGLAPVC